MNRQAAGTRRIHIHLPDDIIREMETRATDQGLSRSGLIAQILRAAVQRQRKARA